MAAVNYPWRTVPGPARFCRDFLTGDFRYDLQSDIGPVPETPGCAPYESYREWLSRVLARTQVIMTTEIGTSDSLVTSVAQVEGGTRYVLFGAHGEFDEMVGAIRCEGRSVPLRFTGKFPHLSSGHRGLRFSG